MTKADHMLEAGLNGNTGRRTSGDLTSFHLNLFTDQEPITHAFCTRTGGTSTGPFESLNLGLQTGDSESNVHANVEKVCLAFGFREDEWLTLRQVHGADILSVDDHASARSMALRGEYDAAVTNTRGITLTILTADCLPVLFFDMTAGAVGVAHAGWRGTTQGIASKVVECMVDEYGADPGKMLVGFGPSIGPCCYEVGTDVAERFISNHGHWERFLREGPGRSWRLDLELANRTGLIELGLSERNMASVGLCTKCQDHLFFSARGQGGKTGRQASFIRLIERQSEFVTSNNPGLP
ncbi:peptidoglycan editing factor PgeF [Thermodesulfobacteriota bacterium]